MRGKWIVWLCLALGALAVPVYAQQEQQPPPPEYTAFSIARLLSDDGTQIEAEFLVSNVGGDATETAQVELRQLGGTALLARGEVEPLAAGGTAQLLLAFPLSEFDSVEPETENVVFELVITSPEFGRERLLAEFTIPAAPGQPAAQNTPAPTSSEDTGGTGDGLRVQMLTTIEGWLAFLPFDVDLEDPVQFASLLGVVLFVLVLVWLLAVIMRLLFTPKPAFPANPPPYAGMPALNPDSLGGRRQMWQQVAQNGSMLAELSEGNLHARKLLLDTNDVRYSGWRAVGLRAGQYDTYGRVARTQVVAPRGVLRRLNRAMRKAPDLTPQAANRRAKPVARFLARRLNRRIKKRGAGLPIALDVKFRGEHGEVNIVFELYQFQLGAWRLLDGWQPEMVVTGKAIHDSYTYTVHGLLPEETMRDFRGRLRDELTYLLAEMLLCTPPAPPPAAPTQQGQRPVSAAVETQENLQAVSGYSAPATASMRPVPPESDDSAVMDTVAHENNSNQGDTLGERD